MRLEGVLNLGHQKLPRQVAGEEDWVRRERGGDAWDIWVKRRRRMRAGIWEKVVVGSMIWGEWTMLLGVWGVDG